MNWFFGFSGNSHQWFSDMIKVAVLSAKKHTRLEPHCLYDGGDNELICWLANAGVKVIRASVPFKEMLFNKSIIAKNIGTHYRPENASGHFLRVLVAKYASTKNVLYTDCDVMFQHDVFFDSVETVGVVNEFNLDYGQVKNGFNSGVMVFNTTYLENDFDELCAFFQAHDFYDKDHNSYDQVLLNKFYENRHIRYLSPIYNWRPFQGINTEARIIHFHGPKPNRIERILSGDVLAGEVGLLRYIEKDRESYTHYLKAFNKYLSEDK
jgi:lipopolysaccharide biosynthesis glycosyltransferase